MSEHLLEASGIVKRFPGVVALGGVDLKVGAGQVVALVGENGAGKSTLMKILAGVQGADEGEVKIDGRRADFRNVREAQEAGVVLIHQELNLAENLSVSANLFLGREKQRGGFLNEKAMVEETRALLKMVGLEVEPDQVIGELTTGKKQLVEIARALSAEARVIIMDEPTSSLSMSESEKLFEVIRGLREKGVSVIYISHRLGEVQRLADEVVVFRDGENAGLLKKGEIEHDRMVNLMVGRDVSSLYQRTEHETGEVVLEVRGLKTQAWPEHEVNFELRAGEVLGVAGLVGAGRSEMLEAIFGVTPFVAGEIRVDGQRVTITQPRHAMNAGLALVPEDRKERGIILEMSVRKNMSLASLKGEATGGCLLNGKAEGELAREMVESLRIVTPNDEQEARLLSGGNQQKIVLAKWLALSPKVLLLDEPTRGIDIGAKEEIYTLVEKLAAKGMAVLFVSSELEEVMGLADRVLVMHEGQLTGGLLRKEFSEKAIMDLATGADRKVENQAT